MPSTLTMRGVPSYEAKGPSVFVKRDLSDKDAKALIDHRYSDDRRAIADRKHGWERLWTINISFLLGWQNMNWGAPLYGQSPTPPPVYRRNYVSNRVLPMAMRQTSKLISAPISWRVRPKTPDHKDQAAAGVGESLLFALQKPCGVDDARWEVATWQVSCGTGFYEVEWDPWANGNQRTYLDPVTRQPIDISRLPPQAKELLEKHRFYKDEGAGDIRVRAAGPFEIHAPPLATGMTLNSAPWLLQSRQYSMDDLWNRWDEKVAKQVEPDTDEGLHTFFIRRIKTMVPHVGFAGGSLEDREQEEVVTVRKLWIPPSKRMPEGRLIVATKDVLLENVPHPLKEMRIRYPFAKVDYAPQSLRFWSKGMIEELLYPQMEFNRTRRVAHEIRDLLGQPKVTAERGSGVGPITSDAGQMVWHNRGFPAPAYMQVTTDHQMHELIANHCLDDLNTSAAQQDVTQAKGEPGVRSGIAIQMLQEQDDRAIGPAVKSGERAIEAVGQMILRFAAKYYDAPRVINIHGEGRFGDVLYFQGSDLRGNDNVVITAGSLMPRSPAVEMEKMSTAWQAGMLNPQNPIHLRLALKTLNVGNSDQLFAQLEADERRASIENILFSSPDPESGFPQVRDFDDHMVHIEVHNQYRKSDSYEMASPEQQTVCDAHVAVHEQHLMLAMQAQMEMQASQKGAPGEKGTASQPAEKKQTPGTKPKESPQ